MKKSTSNVIIGFLAGAATGAALGILYAPDEGGRTRKKIRRNTEKLSSDVTQSLKKQLDSVKAHVNDFVSEIKGKFENIDSEIKSKAEQKQREAAELVEEKAKQAKKTA